MKKIVTVFFLIAVVLLQTVAVSALTSGEAKLAWQDSKQVSKEKQQIHKDAKVDFAADNSEDNKQAVIDTGKDVLHAALDEAEAWLIWKDLDATENPDVPDDLKEQITEDVSTNLDKIDELRTDVDGVTTQLDLGIVFLKMIDGYVGILTDVARNSGSMWVHVANEKLETAEEYEAKLRDVTEDEEIIAKLDIAKADLEEAKRNVNQAEESYKEVKRPGTPLIKFAEGNSYLRVAKTNLLSAHSNLNEAYRMIKNG